MNKKGFTLIELLAVVVLLGVIGAVAFVSVNGITNNMNRKLLEKKAEIIEEAAVLYAQSIKGAIINSNKKYNNNSCVSIKVVDLYPTYLDSDFDCINNSQDAILSLVYQCSDGYNLNNNMCEKREEPISKCELGYNYNNGKCRKSISASISCPIGYTISGNVCRISNQEVACSNNSNCPETKNPDYSCLAGDLNGELCDIVEDPTYECQSGTYNNGSCLITANATSKNEYICQNGFVLNSDNNKCYRKCFADPTNDSNFLDDYEVILYYRNKRLSAKVDLNNNISCE